jgi:hypothetical protein
MRRAKNWIEIISVVSLLVGLGLVIAQLRQNEKLMRFQIATEFRFNQDENRNAVKGENFSQTLAKLQTTPASLTDAELLEFQAHARSLVSELDMRRRLAEVGIFKGDWRGWLQPETCDLMNNAVGRAWLKLRRKAPDQILDDEILAELDLRVQQCDERPSFLKSVREEQLL